MSHLPPVLADLLRRSAAKRRRQAALRGAAEAGTVLVLGLATAAAVDVLLRPEDAVRWACSLGVCAVAAGVFIGRCVRPLLRRFDELEEACAVEADARRHGIAGGDDDLLSSAVALARQSTSGTAGWMVERTIVLAGARAVQLDPLRLADRRPARRAWLRFGSVTVLALVSLAAPGMDRLWLRVLTPWGGTVRPGDLVLTVAPGDVRLIQGDRLAIEATASTPVAGVGLELAWDDGTIEVRQLRREGERTWRLDLDAVAVGAQYRAVAATGSSPRFRIDLVHPPQVGDLRLRVTPPAYTGRPVAIIPASGAEILAGSKVEALVSLQGEPVASATLVLTPGGEQPMTLGPEGATAAFTAPQPGPEGRTSVAIGIHLAGSGAREADAQRRWILSVVADHAPKLALSGRGLSGGMVGRQELIVLDGEASDDDALRDLVLEIAAGDAPPVRRRLALPPAGQTALSLPLELGDLGLVAGDSLSLRLVGTDTGGQTATSVPVQLAVADGDAAALGVTADALREAHRHLADADGALGRLEGELKDLARDFRAEEPEAQRAAIAVARQRQDAVLRQVAAVIAALPRQATAPIGPACDTVGDDLETWCTQNGGMLQAAMQTVAEGGAEARQQAWLAALDANAALARLAGRLATVAARAEAGRLEVRCAAAESRLGRTAGILRAELAWSHRDAGLKSAAMASLPPAVLARASDRLATDGSVLTGVLPALTGLADLLAKRGDDLRRLASAAKAPADELGVIIAAETKEAKALERSEALAPVLANLAVRAREHLDHELAERVPAHPRADGVLAQSRQVADGLRDRAEGWQRLPDPQDPAAAETGAREAAMAAAGVRQLAATLEAEKQRLLARADAPDATLAERRSVLAERRAIDSQIAPALSAARHALAEVAKEPARLRDRRGEVVGAFDQLKAAIARTEPSAAGERGADAANAAREMLAALAAGVSESKVLEEKAQVLAEAVWRQGDAGQAREIVAAVDPAREAPDRQRLRDAAGRILDREHAEEERPLTGLGEDIARVAESKHLAKAGEKLAGAPLELALAAEASRRQQHSEEAVAQERLGRDLAAELGRTGGPRSDEMKELGRRADAIEGRLGGPVRDTELAAAKGTKAEQAVAADRVVAKELEGLADRVAEAATAPERRDGAVAALERFASSTGLAPEARAAVAEGQRLADLAVRAETVRAELAKARSEQTAAAAEAAANRQRYAELERGIADRLAEAGRELAAAAPTVAATAPELAKRLESLQPIVAERAAAAGRLATEVAPPVVAPPAPPAVGVAGRIGTARDEASRAGTAASAAAERAEQVAARLRSEEAATRRQAEELAAKVDNAAQALPAGSAEAARARNAVRELAAASQEQAIADRAAAASAALERLRAEETAAAGPERTAAAAAAAQTAAAALVQAAQDARAAMSEAAGDQAQRPMAAARAAELEALAGQAEQLAAGIGETAKPPVAGTLPEVAPLNAARDAADALADVAERAADAAQDRAEAHFDQLAHAPGPQLAPMAAAAAATKAALAAAPADQAAAEKAADAATALADTAAAEAGQALAAAGRAASEPDPAVADAGAALAAEQAAQATLHAAQAEQMATAAEALAQHTAGEPGTPAAAQAAAAPILAAEAAEAADTAASRAARAAEAAHQAEQSAQAAARRAADPQATEEARAAAAEQSAASKVAAAAAERAKEQAAQAKAEAKSMAAEAAKAATAAAASGPAPSISSADTAPAPISPQAGQPSAAEAATHADAALASASRTEAAALRDHLALPLARAWRAAETAAPTDPAVRHVGELGQDLARLAGEQEEAARLLDQSLRREEVARQHLAEEVAAGESVRAAADTAMGVEPVAAPAAAKAGEAAAAARKETAESIQAWKRAAKASANATDAAEAAAAIREGRAGGDQNAADQRANATAAEASQAQGQAQVQAAQAVAAESAAQAAAASATPAKAAASRAAAAERLASARDAALQAADASEEQREASGPEADRAGAASEKAAASAASARESLLAATDGISAQADRLAAELGSTADSARQAAASENASARSAARSAMPAAMAKVLGPAPASLADSAVGQALATIARSPDSEKSYRQAAASLAAAASAARGAAALQNSGKAEAASQALAAATAASAKPSSSSSSSSAASGSGSGSGRKPDQPDAGQTPDAKAPGGIDQAAWAKLSERIRQAIRSGGSERFGEEHQEAIRAYYRRLGEER